VSGTESKDPIQIDSAVYTVQDGAFNKVSDGLYEINGPSAQGYSCEECPNCEEQDNGPGGAGLFHYTGINSHQQVESGLYGYVENSNSLTKIHGNGLKYFDTINVRARAPECKHLQEASKECAFAKTTCEIKDVKPVSEMENCLHHTIDNNKQATYNVKDKCEVFDVSGKISGKCYKINQANQTIEEVTGPTLLTNNRDTIAGLDNVCGEGKNVQITYRYLKGQLSGEKIPLNAKNIKDAIQKCNDNYNCKGFESGSDGFRYVSNDFSTNQGGSSDLYKKMMLCGE
jgi:hypothetical protein